MTRLIAASLLLALFASPSFADDKQLPEELITTLREASSFELYALNPELGKGGPKALFGYEIKATVEIKAKADREAIIKGLQKSVAEGGPRALCFEPRHGIRVKTEDGKEATFVICFACLQMQVLGPGVEEGATWAISTAARATLDKLLGDKAPKEEDE